MNSSKELLTGLPRRNVVDTRLDEVSRVALVVSQSGLIGLRLEPEREIARVVVVTLDTLPLIREEELGNEQRLAAFFTKLRNVRRRQPTRATEFPLFLSPSTDPVALYAANLRLDYLVERPNEVGINVWSPDNQLSVRNDLPIDTDLRRLITASIRRSKR